MADEGRVVMYCRSWCGDCIRARYWLRANGVDFEEIDIEEEPDGADVVRSIAGKIVTPTFLVGDESCVGFDEPRLRELLLQA